MKATYNKQIPPLTPSQSNLAIPLSTLPLDPSWPPSPFNCTFYPYNHNYDDFFWGCAWRAIQTVLSAYGIETDFKELVMKYRGREALMGVLQREGLAGRVQGKCGWAPEENENCWAEPFIGQIICRDYKLETRLLLINGYPKAYAPQSVFQQTITFTQFLPILQTHLPQSPIMLDDSLLALTIINYKPNPDNTHSLLLADPHITTNKHNPSLQYTNEQILTRPEGELNRIGIYQVVLDGEGRYQGSSVQGWQEELYPCQSWRRVQFYGKKWMVLVVGRGKVEGQGKEEGME